MALGSPGRCGFPPGERPDNPSPDRAALRDWGRSSLVGPSFGNQDFVANEVQANAGRLLRLVEIERRHGFFHILA